MDEHAELDPALMIFFTDGVGAYPEHAPGYPVMWLLAENGVCHVDWGTHVRFKDDR